ncbi:MAG TPA: hypothetical protein VMJ10_29215, partial [Kofleriaceae bacterium]|nr:hypothetical protein [Kofleriaceae bacterium]
PGIPDKRDDESRLDHSRLRRPLGEVRARTVRARRRSQAFERESRTAVAAREQRHRDKVNIRFAASPQGPNAAAAGTLAIGDLAVHRLGFERASANTSASDGRLP